MNRREFTASLAALVAAPALPLPAATRAAAPALPPATYLWADLIARSRGSVDAGFLARRLGLTSDMAHSVMDQLITDGVLKTPGLTGLAKASNPIRFDARPTTKMARSLESAKRKFRDVVKEQLSDEQEMASDTSLDTEITDPAERFTNSI